MNKRFPEATEFYRLRDYAIVGKKGLYEYVAWEQNNDTKELIWLSGKAFVLKDMLVLTRIVEDGPETLFKDLKEIKKALRKLPDWWKKTKFYCAVIDQFASTPCYCTNGEPIEENGEDYKRLQDALRSARVILNPRNPSGKPMGIQKAIAGSTDPF